MVSDIKCRVAQARAGRQPVPHWRLRQEHDERGSLSGEGLPACTAANRQIENEDLVLWYTIGMHHVVRAEDWPVMPVLWHDFKLRPFDFFDRDPALNTSRRP